MARDLGHLDILLRVVRQRDLLHDSVQDLVLHPVQRHLRHRYIENLQPSKPCGKASENSSLCNDFTPLMRFAMEFILEAWWSYPQTETSCLLEDDNFELLRHVDNGESDRLNLGKDTSSKSVRFCDTVLCLGGSSIWKPSHKFEGKWTDNRERGGSNTSKGINAKFLDCQFDPNPCFTSAQLLATINSTFRPLSTASARNAFQIRVSTA